MEPFTALVIYPSTPGSQARQADNFLKLVSEEIRLRPGFLRSRVFLSDDGASLVTLTDWRDRESFQKFRESDFGRVATEIVQELHPKSYWLQQHAEIAAP
jgi:heme-degrading monooxygenase HmoA